MSGVGLDIESIETTHLLEDQIVCAPCCVLVVDRAIAQDFRNGDASSICQVLQCAGLGLYGVCKERMCTDLMEVNDIPRTVRPA